MIRRYGEPPVAGQRYGLRPGAYALLPRGNALLVTFQEAPEPEIQLPGGGIDPGETPAQALIREAYEETGWKIARPKLLGAYRRFAYMPEYDRYAEKLCYVFLASPVRAYGPPTEPGHTALWMSVDTALEVMANDGERDILRCIRPLLRAYQARA